jgi:acylpyruvate hydrolase
MKLATLENPAGKSCAAVIQDNLAILIEGYEDVGAMLRAGERGWRAARGAAYRGGGEPFDRKALRTPVLTPTAVFCVGLNYRTHIIEMGRDLPKFPTLFAKLSRSLTGPYSDIILPKSSQRIDYEAELAVVIGDGGRHISAEDAWQHVAGLTVFNDVTARDYQRRSLQWFAGKNFQQSSPWGPWIVTPDELGEIDSREITLWVNDEERQRASLGDLVFDVPALIADLSAIVELAPGDVIATGTPGGVGEPNDQFLGVGDRVRVRIEGIGDIENVCAPE